MHGQLHLVRGDPPAKTVTNPVLTVSMQSFGFASAPVLGALELSVEANETLAVTGPSGIGKSTLLRIIAGLESRFAGHRRAPSRIAMVFQEPTLLPWRSAAQNLCLTCGIGPGEACDWLQRVGLAGLSDRFPAQLSLGQQRRLSLVRAFAAKPDLLLMDEPFVSLDEALRQDMIALFASLRSARPLATILVTHDASEITRLSTRVIRLSGNPARITENRPIKTA